MRGSPAGRRVGIGPSGVGTFRQGVSVSPFPPETVRASTFLCRRGGGPLRTIERFARRPSRCGVRRRRAGGGRQRERRIAPHTGADG